MRDCPDEIVYTGLDQRPHPGFTLHSVYRGLQILAAVVEIALPVVVLVVPNAQETEATVTLILLRFCVLGCLVLARFARIMNYPVILNERNVQEPYQFGTHMVLWVTSSCPAIMVVRTGNWFSAFSIGWMWLPLSGMFMAMGFYIWRMVTTL